MAAGRAVKAKLCRVSHHCFKAQLLVLFRVSSLPVGSSTCYLWPTWFGPMDAKVLVKYSKGTRQADCALMYVYIKCKDPATTRFGVNMVNGSGMEQGSQSLDVGAVFVS